jgi:hypothetical protein
LQSAGPLPPPGVRRKLLCILEEEEESQIRIASDHHLPYREAIDNMPAKSLLRNSIRISQGALFLLTTLSFSLEYRQPLQEYLAKQIEVTVWQKGTGQVQERVQVL